MERTEHRTASRKNCRNYAFLTASKRFVVWFGACALFVRLSSVFVSSCLRVKCVQSIKCTNNSRATSINVDDGGVQIALKSPFGNVALFLLHSPHFAHASILSGHVHRLFFFVMSRSILFASSFTSLSCFARYCHF